MCWTNLQENGLFYYTSLYPGGLIVSYPLDALDKIPLCDIIIGGHHTHGNYIDEEREVFHILMIFSLPSA